MAGITERNRQKEELTNIGFSMKYIDTWQPKTTLYLHKPSYNVSGEISADVGTAVKGVPGNPDYVLRKARIGLFPWIPSETCTCKWCVSQQVAEEYVVGSAPTMTTSSPQPKKMRRTGPYLEQS